jgi:hypothetical protein
MKRLHSKLNAQQCHLLSDALKIAVWGVALGALQDRSNTYVDSQIWHSVRRMRAAALLGFSRRIQVEDTKPKLEAARLARGSRGDGRR